MCVNLLESLTRRGTDAWGYYDGEQVYKEPGDFRESNKINTLARELHQTGTNIFLCHTRRSTQGNPEVNKNNHPFTLDPFVFAHNGVLFRTEDFENKWTIQTDSFWMLYWIRREYQRHHDVPTAIDEGVDHVEGSYACWLYHKPTETCYLYRIQNPITETSFYKKRNLVVFGSDRISLADALGISPLRRKLGWTPEFRMIPPATIYLVKDGEIWRDGRFTPGLFSRRQYDRFMQLQGDLIKYH